MNKAMVENAMEYAERGWKVFPLHTFKNSSCSCGSPKCASAAKHPRIKEWQKSCSASTDQITDWWSKWPDANIGLASGKASGFFVLDIDPRHGGKESLQKLVRKNGMFPKTLSSSTGGGGYHLFFKEPQAEVRNRVNVLPGLDVRGDGGYVVAPPSFHKSGVQYSWLKDFKDCPIHEPPQWLLNFFDRNTSDQRALSTECSGSVGEGGRNNYLTSHAGKLRRGGFEQGQILAALRKLNIVKCSPPLGEEELKAICASVSRYPSGVSAHSSSTFSSWSNEPRSLDSSIVEAPSLSSDLMPECLKPWIGDISDRMQVTPEFVLAPAMVAFSSVVGRKIGIHPKQHDDWLVVPNLWGAIVARPGYFKSPTIAEAMTPLENLSERARIENESNQHQLKATQMIADMQLEAIKDAVRKAIKEGDDQRLDSLREQVKELEADCEASALVPRRYKTNDATVEKVARLLNENQNGMLMLRDELNGWLQTLNKSGREGDREFYLESWNGYGSYSIDRVGSGTLHVPALCLSVFGGIQPGKLKAYVEKTLQGNNEDDGLLQRFQMLIYPELTPEWKNIDRGPDILARERVFDVFNKVDIFARPNTSDIPGVRFSQTAQEAFNAWRQELEKRLRSNELGCPAFESHLAKYRSLMPSLALLFWILEDAENLQGSAKVSLDAATLAIKWCRFLEQHALKAYRIGQSAEVLAVKKLADCIKGGLVENGMPVRSLYRKQWSQLKNTHLMDHAIETLEDHNWLRVSYATVQGGRSKRVNLHPSIQNQIGGAR